MSLAAGGGALDALAINARKALKMRVSVVVSSAFSAAASAATAVSSSALLANQAIVRKEKREVASAVMGRGQSSNDDQSVGEIIHLVVGGVVIVVVIVEQARGMKANWSGKRISSSRLNSLVALWVLLRPPLLLHFIAIVTSSNGALPGSALCRQLIRLRNLKWTNQDGQWKV